jgi:hypothetical protein
MALASRMKATTWTVRRSIESAALDEGDVPEGLEPGEAVPDMVAGLVEDGVVQDRRRSSYGRITSAATDRR